MYFGRRAHDIEKLLMQQTDHAPINPDFEVEPTHHLLDSWVEHHKKMALPLPLERNGRILTMNEVAKVFAGNNVYIYEAVGTDRRMVEILGISPIIRKMGEDTAQQYVEDAGILAECRVYEFDQSSTLQELTSYGKRMIYVEGSSLKIVGAIPTDLVTDFMDKNVTMLIDREKRSPIGTGLARQSVAMEIEQALNPNG